VRISEYLKLYARFTALCLYVTESLWAICCRQDDVITLKVNKLSSTKAQLPFEYYSLPYCRPPQIISSAENLGEVLRGDRIENSLYQVILHTHHHPYHQQHQPLPLR
jgi:hypothetical protein